MSRLPALATVTGGLALVLAFRLLYLARFGYDPCWMNFNFLLEAKAMRFGYPAEYNGMPLVPALLLAGRSLGASAAVSLGAVYLAAHALLAAGTFALARRVLSRTPRQRSALALAVAVLPLFSTDSGYRNLSCTLAAGLLAALAGLVLSPAAGDEPPPRGIRTGNPPAPLRLAGVLLLAAAAAACRSEAVLAVGALTVALAVFGDRLGCGRRGALASAAGLAVGLAFVATWDHRLARGAGHSTGLYAFYCFYVATPFALRIHALLQDPSAMATEYARYVETARLFGGFEENGGSILRALLRRPGDAAVWLLAKPLDLAVGIFSPDSFTPVAVVSFVQAVRRGIRQGIRSSAARWAPLLAAFGAPLAFLLAWAPGHAQYVLVVSPLLLLAAMWGLEPWLERASAVAFRRTGWAVALGGALVVLSLGHTSASSAPILGETARWLERRCSPGGCLVNALPQALDSQAWADLQSGSELPEKVKRSEAFVYRRYPPSYLAAVSMTHRMSEARRRGWDGPILYVRVGVRSVETYSEDFDPEHRLEGEPDLSAATEVARFEQGADSVQVLQLPPGAASGPRAPRPERPE